MMAETLVEKNVCKECGADVRPQTAFCYNCGKPVAPGEPETNHADEASDVWFGETIVNEEPIVNQEPVVEVEEPVQEIAAVEEPVQEIAEPEPEPEPEPVGQETESNMETIRIDPLHHSLPVESGLKSAASIRRKPKTFNKREVEVVWEEHEKPPTLKLILVTLFLVLFTIIVFLIAMQMK
jgi:hypothetical protein